MDSYHVIIDVGMIENIVETNLGEARDLFSLTLVLYVIFLGLLPSWFVWQVNITFKPVRQEIWGRLKLIASILLPLLVLGFMISASLQFISKRTQTNPVTF